MWRGTGIWFRESPESIGKQNVSRELRDAIGSANRLFPGFRERPGISASHRGTFCQCPLPHAKGGLALLILRVSWRRWTYN